MSGILDIALSGLRASQTAIDITAHNVANASTEGYSRQRPVLVTSTSQIRSNGLLGGGVEVKDAERITDRWTEQHLNTELGDKGYYDGLSDRLGQVEAVFNEVETPGIAASISDLYSSLGDLVNDPQNMGARTNFAYSAQTVAERLRNANTQLTQAYVDTKTTLDADVITINQQLDQVASLNGQIFGMIRNGQSASDLQDQRDSLLRSLSEKMGGSAFVTNDMTEASFSVGGTALVLGATAMHIGSNTTGLTLAENGQQLNMTNGREAALVDTIKVGGQIDQYRTQLDTLANGISSAFNAVSTTGYGLDGVNGRALFTGAGAANIAVNQDMLDHPDHVAASASGAPGDNTKAMAMMAIRTTPTIGTQTIEDYQQTIVAAIGVSTKAAKTQADSLSSMVDSLKTRSEEVRGVSLDEEMANLIQFQQVYNASARLVKMVDDMTTAVLNMVQ